MSLSHNAYLIHLPKVCDERGSLVAAEQSDIPFPIMRVFWIYGVPEGKTRGGHAHHTQGEVIFPVRGSFDIFVDDGTETNQYHMDTPQCGIYIGPGVWSQLHHFSEDCVCVVLCSEKYDGNGYVKTYEDFKKLYE